MSKPDHKPVIQATPKKKPPMAAAIRAFVTGMEFPKDEDTNASDASFVVTMLQFCYGLTPDAEVAVCSPALSQVAEVLHCSERNV
jgi:hypothetical protein